MDLLQRLNQAYASSSEDEEESEPKEMMKSSTKLELAPQVDISDLEFAKQMKELTKFETTNQIIRK